jgi:aminocarboxymuconate-semialdehyde decarboxylase
LRCLLPFLARQDRPVGEVWRPAHAVHYHRAVATVIDIHAHYVPAALIAAARRERARLGVRLVEDAATPALHFANGFKVRPFFPKLIEPVEQRIAWLDDKKIDYQLVATWPDIYGYGLAPEQRAAWHRVLNDTLAAWCSENTTRFGFIASVPLPSADDAAAELGRVVEIGAVGVMVPANVEGTNLGELKLDAFWAKAEVLRLPVILHPVMATPAPRAMKFALAQSVHYPFDTTLGAGSLIFSGVLDRFPRLELVLAHGGGAYPYLAGRLDLMHARMDRQAQGDVATRAPSEYLSVLAYDSIVHSAKSLRFLADLVGIERLLLGTDYSFPPADLDPLASLRAAGFDDGQVQAIACDNVRRIFPRIKR